MHLASPKYERQVDHLLKFQYHEICFNPAKREAFLRLTSNDPAHLHSLSPSDQPLDGPSDTSLLRNYIRQVYQTYGIEDPIKKELRLADRRTAKTTPEKSLNVTSLTDGDRLTRTKKKLLNMKDSFKRDSEDVVYSSQYSHNPPYQEGQSSIMTSKINREIGYRTKQKIRFKTDTNDQIQHSHPVLREFTLGNNQSQIKNNIKIREYSKGNARQKRKEVADIFQYCPMCEDMVREQNALLHQSRCQQWQLAQRMPPHDFQRLIQAKIKTLEEEIHQQLYQKDQQNMVADFTDLASLIKLWMQQSQRSSFNQIKTKFQSFSLNLFEKLAKLNWFRGFQRRIQGDWGSG